jgi:RHS repeat-associated protein
LIEFTGQYRDPETSFDWFNVRHMSGAQGRFQSPDPANAGADPTNPQTWNAYAYVGNNPLSYTDPSGMIGEATGIGASTGNPVGIAIGAAVDLGLALWGIFGGAGGPSVPNWAGTAWAVGPGTLQPSPAADWEQTSGGTVPDDGSDEQIGILHKHPNSQSIRAWYTFYYQPLSWFGEGAGAGSHGHQRQGVVES